ncbi:MAG: prolyl oligopeptidase family serine peptidase [Chitinophagales bacterium]
MQTPSNSYQLPPQSIIDLVDAKRSPGILMSPNGAYILLTERPSLPSIELLARPELKLAGIRLNPRTNGRTQHAFTAQIRLKTVNHEGGEHTEKVVSHLPPNAQLSQITWSPDNQKVAFCHTTADHIQLWYFNILDCQAKQLTSLAINSFFQSKSFVWTPDSQALTFKAVVQNRETAPEKPLKPKGPVVMESDGEAVANRTYQDLLKDEYDEALFSYYATSQIYTIDLDNNLTSLGKAGLFLNVAWSPNGTYLLTQELTTPFSYAVPYARFPKTIQVWNKNGQVVKQLAHLPLAENIPTAFGSVRKGKRNILWRSDVPASLSWVEAQDDGDASKETPIRDCVFCLAAPFDQTPRKILDLPMRFNSIDWGNGQRAIVYHYWWKTRQIAADFFAPDAPEQGLDNIYIRSFEDRYTAPGNFLTAPNNSGTRQLVEKDGQLFLIGEGASPEGNRPFIDSFDIATKTTKRLWRSEAPHYERPYKLLGKDLQKVLTTKETLDSPMNLFIRDLNTTTTQAITHFPHPYPSLKQLRRELIHYEREDGVKLTATLYCPPHYDSEKDGRLPVLLWAYPKEFKSAKLAGQVKDSPFQFTYLGFTSPLLFLAQGYAILYHPDMPIIGENEEEPNDTYLEQLVSNAQAAIDKVVDMGVADRTKIAVGGHSYGAFMTANLMAHSDLFAAGIARSGAYNRTLTPFGFQAEERDLWQAPEMYLKMSPFMNADRIKKPLLLLHGDSDSNSGTYPMQSERFYNALKSQGATVRLVMLPHESHGYFAKESVMHTLWEMNQWMEKYV